MSSENQINYVEFQSKDIAKTKTFFSAVFGWSFTDWGEEYASFNDGKIDGGIYRSDNAASVENGSVLIIFYGEHLEDLREKVQVNGAEISRDIFSFPGGRRFHFIEPGGNELAIWSDK